VTEHRTPTFFVPALLRFSRFRDEANARPGAAQLSELGLLEGTSLAARDVEEYFRRPGVNPVELSDVMRYLVVYLRGGLYVDCDVTPEATVDSWLPTFGYNDVSLPEIDLLVGVEFKDESRVGDMVNPMQFSQAIFFAGRPKSPVLREVLLRCVRSLEKLVHHEAVGGGQKTDRLMQAFGPPVWTRAILDVIAKESMSGRPSKDVLDDNGALIKLKGSTNLLILPYRAFGYSSAHKGVPERDLTQHLVLHKLHGFAPDGWRQRLFTFAHEMVDEFGHFLSRVKSRTWMMVEQSWAYFAGSH